MQFLQVFIQINYIFILYLGGVVCNKNVKSLNLFPPPPRYDFFIAICIFALTFDLHSSLRKLLLLAKKNIFKYTLKKLKSILKFFSN